MHLKMGFIFIARRTDLCKNRSSLFTIYCFLALKSLLFGSKLIVFAGSFYRSQAIFHLLKQACFAFVRFGFGFKVEGMDLCLFSFFSLYFFWGFAGFVITRVSLFLK